MLMLLNLSPGSWEFNYPWLVHAKWEGWTLIDMVAPAFLFCIGAAMPLSMQRRSEKGASRQALLSHVLWRSLLLVAIGFFLNLYPNFDFATVRIPGVLQRIGLCYGLIGAFMLVSARAKEAGALILRPGLIAGAAVFVLVSYWVLLYFVPVPGFGAPRFDAGRQLALGYRSRGHRRRSFLSALAGGWKSSLRSRGNSFHLARLLQHLARRVGRNRLRAWRTARPALLAVVAGAVMMIVAVALHGVCPIIKNIWTSTFALFSGGFCVASLGLLMPVTQVKGVRQVFWPARIFGENPLLAYIIVFLIAPLIDYNWFGTETAPLSLRGFGHAWFGNFAEPNMASLLFGLCGLAAIFAVLVVCHRKRWILKL